MTNGGQAGLAEIRPIAAAPLRPNLTGTRLSLKAVEAQGRGSLSGQVTVSYSAPQQAVTVSVHASGFVPNTSHAAHIHSGSCAVQGAPLYMLGDLRAGPDGRIDQTKIITGVISFSPPHAGWYVNIHEGDGEHIVDANMQPTVLFEPRLCGNMATTMPVMPQNSTTTTVSTTSTTMQSSDGSHGNVQPETLEAELTPGNMPAPELKNAKGSAVITLDPRTSQVCYNVFVSGIGQVTSALIQRGSAGVDDPIVINLVPPAASGSSRGCATPGLALIQSMMAAPAGFYVNVLTVSFPQGAIGGQLHPDLMHF